MYYAYIYNSLTCSFLNRFSWWRFKSQEALGDKIPIKLDGATSFPQTPHEA